MFIEWKSDFEINVSVIDAEHRYLVQLISDLHLSYVNNYDDKNLINIFSNLAAYTKEHFQNEESVMAKINYPGLESQKNEHQKLLEKVRKLSEQYLDGSENITSDTLEFLKSWLVDHILDSDKKIGEYVKLNPLPSDWKPELSILEGIKDVFKQCTLCGKNWITYEDFVADKSKKVLGCQIDPMNHMYNLIMVNCGCGTTLGFFLSNFVGVSSTPFVLEERNDNNTISSYCLKKDKTTSCYLRCACNYTSKILKELTD